MSLWYCPSYDLIVLARPTTFPYFNSGYDYVYSKSGYVWFMGLSPEERGYIYIGELE